MKRVIFPIVAMAMLLALSGCGRKSPVIAVVGSRAEITVADLKANLEKRPGYDPSVPVPPDTASSVLQKMINDKTKWMYAIDKKMDQDTAFMKDFEVQRRRIILQRFFEKQILEDVIPESDIRSYYTKMDKEISARNIFFKCPIRKPKTDEEKAKFEEEENEVRKKAEDVWRRIKSGEDFASLARQYSEDKQTAPNGGYIERLIWNRSDDPYLQQAFSLKPGKVSDVFRNNQGFSILKAEEIRKQEVEPFSEARGKIAEQLRTERREAVAVKRNAYFEELKAKYRLKWNEPFMDSLYAGISRIRKTNENLSPDSIAQIISVHKDSVFATHIQGKVTVSDWLERTQNRIPFRQANPAAIKDGIFYWKLNDWLLECAIEKGVDREPRIKESIAEQKDKYIISELTKREIGIESDFPDDEILAYYREHVKDRYLQSEKVKVQEVLVQDQKMAEMIYRRAMQNEDFGRLASQYTIRNRGKENGGLLTFAKGSYGAMGQAAFDMQPGKIGGPFAMPNGQYSVIKLLEKIPPRPYDLNMVRSRVIREMLREKQQKREEEWLAKIRPLIPALIHEDVFKKDFNPA